MLRAHCDPCTSGRGADECAAACSRSHYHRTSGWVRTRARPRANQPLVRLAASTAQHAATAKRKPRGSTPEPTPSDAEVDADALLSDLEGWQLAVRDPDVLDEEGNPTLRVVEGAQLRRPVVYTEELLEELDGVDIARADATADAAAAQVQVPDLRLITDSEELELIGEGLPIINGEEWPDVYWKAIEDICSNQAVKVPSPHPKLTVQDMVRIAESGPRFSDLVLEHAERVYEPDEAQAAAAQGAEGPLGEAYTYIPFNVLGDYRYEPEPDWLTLPQTNFYEFYHGLRERNWTSKHFKEGAEPWRLQFFSCGYRGVTGWPGWRVVLTRSNGERSWVDMPFAGAPSFLKDYALGTEQPKRVYSDTLPPGELGYNQVFEQLFQAYEQRLPLEGVLEYCTSAALTPGRYPYDCPGDRLLDVSWHHTANSVQSAWAQFLMRPSPNYVVQAVRHAINESGVFELKAIRDLVCFTMLPALPKPRFHFDMTGAGPLYFIICLTAGVVVPALRRSKILDIKTLEEDPGAAQEFARSKASARKEGLTGVVFKDIAGLDPILNEVMEVVEFLKDPRQFSKLGARPPKGILLEGEPGTGKTLLAKALAGEAMVPFYQMSGTEFTEGIVGLGAARVRDLFKRARVSAPCLIFVDELDALGLKRADGQGKANEEREQTLNQLLTEMDGFTPDTGVVFIGATNRADLLDPALMRPGRFDRKIRMPKPDTQGRMEILQLHLRNKRVAPDVDLLQLARDLPGLVGADIANIVNEAQLNAVRAGRDELTKRDIYAGVDRFTQGEVRPPLPSTHKLPVLAFAAKEVGIALVATLLRARYGRIEPVERVSIQPKGKSISRTLFARGVDEDYHLITRGRLMDRIRCSLAGSIAVKVVLGEDTNFAIADIKRAHQLIEKLVFYYGMSDFGITSWAKQPYASDFFLGSHRPRKVISIEAMDAYADWPTRLEDFRFDPQDPSDVTWHRYSDEVRKIMKSCYEEVWGMLEEHRQALWAGVREMADKREMLGQELIDVFDAHPPQPSDAAVQLEMQIFTNGRDDRWPYGIEWLDDAYPTPYWVKKQREEDEQKKREQEGRGAAATAAGGNKPS